METTALPKEKFKGLVTKKNSDLLASSHADSYGISVSQISVFEVSAAIPIQ